MMPKVHELKTDPIEFQQTWAGYKKSEVRYNDREYCKGHYLLLRETVHNGAEMSLNSAMPLPLEYTGRHIMAKITHMHFDQGMELNQRTECGWVVLSTEVLDKHPHDNIFAQAVLK